MSGQASHSLTVVEAARKIYRTAEPSADQIGHVVKKIETGVLERGPKGGATTTMAAVADYLARREMSRAFVHVQGSGGPSHSSPRKATDVPVSIVYQHLIKDYFLAVLLRRSVGQRSATFRWAVIGAQVVMLAAALFVLGAVASRTLRRPVVPPHETAIRAWLNEHYENIEVRTLEPLDKSLSTFRVTFSYRVNNKRIDSSLECSLQGSQVVNVTSGD
jgi:hypothetical protein